MKNKIICNTKIEIIIKYIKRRQKIYETHQWSNYWKYIILNKGSLILIKNLKH